MEEGETYPFDWRAFPVVADIHMVVVVGNRMVVVVAVDSHMVVGHSLVVGNLVDSVGSFFYFFSLNCGTERQFKIVKIY